uniref:Uncharacterized protein n=1 Tax=Knipowitschia caucasica TaxID=637954 RepID=A0AAV2MLT2_KNICA
MQSDSRLTHRLHEGCQLEPDLEEALVPRSSPVSPFGELAVLYATPSLLPGAYPAQEEAERLERRSLPQGPVPVAWRN